MNKIEILHNDFNIIDESAVLNLGALKDKCFLITGVYGMISEYMVHYLMHLNQTSNMGIHIIGVDRAGDNRFKQYIDLKWMEIIYSDVRESINVNWRIDYIIHAASPTSPYAYEHFPADVATINMIGTWRMLEQAKKCGAVLLLVSSSAIYGSSSKIEILEDTYGELNPLETSACYSEGKRAAETLCVSYNRQYGVDARIARCRRVFGPTVNINAKSLLNKLLKSAARSETIEMYRDPTNMLQLLYVGDAVTGLLKVCLDGKSSEAYNVCSHGVVSVDDLAQLLTEISDEHRLTIKWVERTEVADPVRTKVQINRNNACCSNMKLSQLGWVPLFGIRYGLRSTIYSLSSECK